MNPKSKDRQGCDCRVAWRTLDKVNSLFETLTGTYSDDLDIISKQVSSEQVEHFGYLVRQIVEKER